MYLKTEGLVLRQVNYQDADQILTLLTKEYGLMSVKARGVRRNSSRLKSACQLLAYSEFVIFENKGFHTVNEAAPLQMFPELRGDIESLALASYFAQAAEVLSQENLPNPDVLSLTLNAFYVLCHKRCPPDLIKAAFELRLAAISGYMPDVSGCSVCGNPQPDRFDVAGGVLMCAHCAAGAGLRLPVSAGTLAAMRYIITCDKKKLFSFRLEGSARKELCDLAETYLVTQLERGFYTLDFYKSLIL